MAKYKGYSAAMDSPVVPDETKQVLFEMGFRSGQEDRIRAELKERGWRLMHRRNGKYWVICRDSMTLNMIEAWIAAGKERSDRGIDI